MRKIITSIAMLIVAITMVVTAMFAGNVRSDVSSPGGANEDELVFYGWMDNNDEWTSEQQPDFKKAIYSFTTDGSGFSACTAINSSAKPNIYYSGVFVGGKYYNVSVLEGSMFNYTSNFNIIDTDTWEVLDTKSYAKSNMMPFDMAYDYIGAKAYAVSPKGGYGSTRNGTYLNEVNLETGEFTQIGEISDYMVYALACDGNGQLWGIGTPGDLSIPTTLFKINKATAAIEVVGDTGMNLYTASHSSAVFDLHTGKLYWTAMTYVEDQYSQRTWTTGLFEINTATGKATLVRQFMNNEILTGLFIKDSHPKAPERVKDLRFEFDANSITAGKVKFTLPTLSYDGTPLSGTLSVKISVDGTTNEYSGLTPGSNYESTSSITLGEGASHFISVTCKTGSLESLPSKADVFAGEDGPSPVTGLTVTSNDRGDKVTVSWTAPTVGVNGGYIDAANLTYDVVLKPDNITVAEGIKETQCNYEFTRKMGISQFQVVAHVGGASSTVVASPVMLLGTPWTLPYLETFSYQSEVSWPFTVIDANNDGSDEVGDKWFFDPNNNCALYYLSDVYYGNPADDWLITPSIDLAPGNVYRLQFDTWGYMGGTNHIVATIGALPTPESQRTELLNETFLTTEGSKTFSTLFIPTEGDCRIGFHNIGDAVGGDHVYLDNIYVSLYGTTAIPAASNIELRKDGSKVVVSGTTPTKTVAGAPISSLSSLRIYRTAVGSTPLHTIDNPGVGASFEWTDENPNLGENIYIVVAVSAEGNGVEATASIDTRADIPKAVENVMVSGRNNWTEAVVSWSYPEDGLGVNGLPLEESEIMYDVYRTIGVKTEVVAENLSACTFVDADCVSAFANGAQQGYVVYRITPKTSGGEGRSTSSKSTLVGKAYDLPFKETWTAQSIDNAPWEAMNQTLGASWGVASTGYDPVTGNGGQDGYGLVTFSIGRSYSSGSADYVSPRIDMSNFKNVEVSFYIYQSTSAATSGATLQVGFNTEENGTVMSADVYNVYGNENGWKQYVVPVPAEFAGSDRVSVVFRGTTSSYQGCIHLDNVQIRGEQPDYEVKASAITGAENCLIGNDNVYNVEVENIGAQANGNIKVDFFVDGELMGSETIEAIASGQTVAVPFTFRPSLNNEERELMLSAEISAENDGSDANNYVEASVSLVAPMLPYVNDLKVSSANKVAYLSWSEAATYPHQEYVTDGAEAYQAFAISGAGGWKFVDVDGGPTISGLSLNNTLVTWDNAGSAQAFMVFNPSLAGDGSVDLAQVIAPRSGKQCFVSFAARGGNDDWMISPQLSGDAQTISFYAKAAYPYDLNERFEVWVSETSADVESFTKISGDNPVVVSSASDWRRFDYTLQEGVKFFAIRCVSYEQTGLMIDDITYSPAYSALQFWGYNIYRDGEKITADPIGDVSYIDSDVVVDKEYGYNVTAVYKEGESIFSNYATVKISEEESGIGSMESDVVSIKVIEKGVKVLNAEKQPIYVYTMDGRTVYSLLGSGEDYIPLTTGIYIVRAGNTTVKVAIR